MKQKDFEYGRQLVKRLLFMTVAFAMASWLMPRGSYGQLGLMLLAALSLAGEIAVLCVFCRCPHCGKRIVMGTLAVTTCPRCHRNLATGKKTKKR